MFGRTDRIKGHYQALLPTIYDEKKNDDFRHNRQASSRMAMIQNCCYRLAFFALFVGFFTLLVMNMMEYKHSCEKTTVQLLQAQQGLKGSDAIQNDLKDRQATKDLESERALQREQRKFEEMADQMKRLQAKYDDLVSSTGNINSKNGEKDRLLEDTKNKMSQLEAKVESLEKANAELKKQIGQTKGTDKDTGKAKAAGKKSVQIDTKPKENTPNKPKVEADSIGVEPKSKLVESKTDSLPVAPKADLAAKKDELTDSKSAVKTGAKIESPEKDADQIANQIAAASLLPKKSNSHDNEHEEPTMESGRPLSIKLDKANHDDKPLANSNGSPNPFVNKNPAKTETADHVGIGALSESNEDLVHKPELALAEKATAKKDNDYYEDKDLDDSDDDDDHHDDDDDEDLSDANGEDDDEDDGAQLMVVDDNEEKQGDHPVDVPADQYDDLMEDV